MFLHMSVCPQGEVVTQHALQVVSQHALQVSRGCVSQHALQVVSQHVLQVSGGCISKHALQGSLRGLAGGFSRPTPGGSPDHTQRVSRSTPRGAFRPTPGGSPGPHQGGVSRPTPRWCIQACTEADPPTDGFCCRRCASYWNAFLFKYLSIHLSHQHQFHLVHDPTKNSPKPFMWKRLLTCHIADIFVLLVEALTLYKIITSNLQLKKWIYCLMIYFASDFTQW